MNEQAWKEQAARIIDPASWAVMDSYLKQMLRKYKGQNIGYDPEAFKHKESMAIAAALWPLVQQAIAAERERCAKVAEDWNIDWARPSGYMPDDIAAAIRSLKEADNGAGNECICPKCGLRHGGKVDSGAVF